MNLTDEDKMFLQVFEDTKGLRDPTMKALDITKDQFSYRYQKLKEVIQDRTRDILTRASMRAALTTEELLDADADTDQGVLRLRAAAEILDRSGITKHTNIDVSVETENGLFILPGKAPGIPVPDSDTDT